MSKKIVACVTLVCFVLFMQSCYSRKWLTPDQLMGTKGKKILKIEMADGTSISCLNRISKGGQLVDDQIVCTLEDGTTKTISLSDVRLVYVKQVSAGKTILGGLGGASILLTIAGIVVLVVLTSALIHIGDESLRR